MAGNKLRLYVAYWRRTPSKTSNQIFHTGLLLIPKNPQNDERTTARYHVVNRIDPGTKLETWMFEPTLQLLPRTNKLSGLMLLGKVPPEFTAEGIEAILRTVHIPTPQELANIEARGDTWRCRYWVADALNALVAAGVIPPLPHSSALEVVKTGSTFIERKTSDGNPVHNDWLYTCDPCGREITSEIRPITV